MNLGAAFRTLLLFSLVVSAACSARAPARTFADLQLRVRPGHTVYVIDDTGTESRGNVSAIDGARLSLDVNGVVRQLDESRVRQVQRHGDSLWNGALIGVGIALPGMLLGDARYVPCAGDQARQCRDNDIPYRVAAVGIFGVIGAGIDALSAAGISCSWRPGRPRPVRCGSPRYWHRTPAVLPYV